MTNLKSKQQAAARKRRQRARQVRQEGAHKLEVMLTDREWLALETGCISRNQGRTPYSKTEYIALLLLADEAALAHQVAQLGTCPRCSESLPATCNGLFRGETACWLTLDCLSLNLSGVTGHKGATS